MMFFVYSIFNYLPNLKVAMETVSERISNLCARLLFVTREILLIQGRKICLKYVDLAGNGEDKLISLDKIWPDFATQPPLIVGQSSS